ncbi:protein kinase domain-containing protein [Endozoicomonas ascidiicola]|uniref:protein kinase domain-containing protein n=1 Tax=Endozoicomonas ascidiicola TaxID=1698521 RepID=UPI00082B7128|nr:protein kinase [Endozoicomonas ascidiicola]
MVAESVKINNCPNFTTIEDGFTLPDSLNIGNCPKFVRFPEELTVGHCLFVENCPALKAISTKLSVGAGLYFEGCTGLESIPENLHVPWGLNLTNCRSFRYLPQKISLGGTLTLTGCCRITSIPDWVTRLGVNKDGETRDIHLEGTGLSEALIAELQAMDTPGIKLHLPNIKEDYKEYYFDLLAEIENRNQSIHSNDNESSLQSRLMRKLINLGVTSESAKRTGRHFIFCGRHIVEMENNNGDLFLMFRSTGTACQGTEGCWVPFPGILNSENHKDWFIKGWNEGSYQYSYEDIKHHQYHIPFFQNVAIQLSEAEHTIFPELPDRSTRKDKHKLNKPFTTVEAKSLDGQVLTAELLNTLPEQVLTEMGCDPKWINQLPEREKKHPLSADAVDSLTNQTRKKHKLTDIPNTKAKYIGESMSPVKFARLSLPGSDAPVICAAKKIHKPFLQTNRLINEEASRQNSSGHAPKVYGVAKTVTKDGKAQRILLMDIAKGIHGDQFIRSCNSTMSESKKIQVAQEFATTVQSMHKNDVCHGDLKPANSFIDPKTLNIQLIDFGLASGSTRTASRNSLNMSTAPELSLPCNLWTNETTIDMEKVDVFSLGYILTTLFGSKTFAADGKGAVSCWNPDTNITELENIIHNELSSITFSNPEIKTLVTHMMDANPANRPTMEVVVNTIHSWSAQTAKGQDRPDLFIR